MKSRFLLAALTLASFAAAQKPAVLTTDGKKSGLSASALSSLRTPGLRHLVPTWVPPGFKVIKFDYMKKNADEEGYWTAKYRNTKLKADFTIQMASDGFGDPILSDEDGNVVDSKAGPSWKSPIFGTGRLWVGKSKKWNGFASDWIELKGKTLPTHVMIYGQRIDPQWGKKVLESLRWLK